MVHFDGAHVIIFVDVFRSHNIRNSHTTHTHLHRHLSLSHTLASYHPWPYWIPSYTSCTPANDFKFLSFNAIKIKTTTFSAAYTYSSAPHTHSHANHTVVIVVKPHLHTFYTTIYYNNFFFPSSFVSILFFYVHTSFVRSVNRIERCFVSRWRWRCYFDSFLFLFILFYWFIIFFFSRFGCCLFSVHIPHHMDTRIFFLCTLFVSSSMES